MGDPQPFYLFVCFHCDGTYQVMICLLQYFVESLTVVLPYYPTGTMERVVKEGQVRRRQNLRGHKPVSPPSPRIISSAATLAFFR